MDLAIAAFGALVALLLFIRPYDVPEFVEVDSSESAFLIPLEGDTTNQAAFQSVDLAFAIHTRETFESRLKESNVFRVRHAKAMLATYDQGRPIRHYSYPVQAVAFGKDLTLVALGRSDRRVCRNSTSAHWPRCAPPRQRCARPTRGSIW